MHHDSFSRYVLLLSAVTIAGLTQAETVRQLDAHEHGTATLSVAVDGDQLLIEFDSPAVNLIGFEHAPDTEQQHSVADAAKALLGDTAKLFALSSEAHCTLADSGVAWSIEEHGGLADEDMHSEFRSNYLFQCSTPTALDAIDVRLIEAFPGIEEIEARLITPSAQRGEVLTAGNNRLTL